MDKEWSTIPSSNLAWALIEAIQRLNPLEYTGADLIVTKDMEYDCRTFELQCRQLEDESFWYKIVRRT